MRKIILLTLLISVFHLTTRAQLTIPNTTPSEDSIRNFHLMQAGNELQKFHKSYMTGVWFTVGGAALYVVASPLLAEEEDAGAYMALAGSASIIAGTIIMLVSHRHIKIAGQELQFAGNGVGIPIPIKKKH